MKIKGEIFEVKGAIFDLDGTLIDSMPFWEKLGSEYIRRKGFSPPENTDEILKKMSLEQAARYLRENYPVSDSIDDIIKEVVMMIENQYRLHVPLKPSVVPFLESLRENNVRMCIATANNRELTEAVLERLNVSRYFEFILTCTEAGVGKESPDFFLKALERLKTPRHETVVFEDALHAIKSAKAAGLYVAAVYDRSSHDDREEIMLTADVYLDSFDDWKVL